MKICWSILKTFYNDKKIPLILPLLIEKKIVTNIRAKANIFNTFFTEQCTPLKNGNVLPSSQEILLREKLCSLDFSNDKILKLIRSLNVHKIHGHDDVSIKMIKICDKSFVKPLITLTLLNCLIISEKKKLILYLHIRKARSSLKLSTNFFVPYF